MFNPQVIAVPYRIKDLKEAFSKALNHHFREARNHPMGATGLHETFARQAITALGLIKIRGWNDDDAIIFPGQLADFATATTQNPPEGLESFNQYYVANRFTLIPARDTTKLFPR